MLTEHALTTIEALKGELQIPAEDTSQDAVLARYINAASDAIRAFCSRDFAKDRRTETKQGFGGPSLLLKAYPVLEVHSVEVKGKPVTDYSLDEATGVLWRDAGWPRSETPNVTVDYTAGYVTPAQADDDETLERDLPHDLEEACIGTAATWASQQGTPRDAVSMQVEQIRVDFGNRNTAGGRQGIPWPVQALLEPYVRWA